MIAQRIARSPLTWCVLATCVLASLAISFAREFARPEDMTAPTYGTAWAPYSDALGPWLAGALSILFEQPPPDYLYRPTVGYFWASILAATGRVEAIPFFFAAWLFALLAAAAGFATDARVRRAMVIALGVVALSFGQTWASLFISSTNVDMPALAFTATGVLLLCWGTGEDSRPALWAGCLCLGIAAAIRGPMLLAGLPILAVRLALLERACARTILPAAILFVLPLVIDAWLQRRFGVTSNGLMAMYCFQWDPTHTWTPACNESFLARGADATAIASDYSGYLASPDGFTVLRGAFYRRVARDVVPLAEWTVLGMLLAAGWLAGAARLERGRRLADEPWVRAAVIVAVLAVVRALGSWPPWSAAAGVSIVLAAAAWLRAWRAVMCLAGYVAATLFLCLLGLAQYDRLQQTFSICLYLGLALAMVETGANPDARARPAARLAAPAAAALAILFLALGHLGPSRWRDAYLREVHGRPGVAIKLGADPRVDRSLYQSGQGQLFYTTSDALPVGSVRRYRGLSANRGANESFRQPDSFLNLAPDPFGVGDFRR